MRKATKKNLILARMQDILCVPPLTLKVQVPQHIMSSIEFHNKKKCICYNISLIYFSAIFLKFFVAPSKQKQIKQKNKNSYYGSFLFHHIFFCPTGKYFRRILPLFRPNKKWAQALDVSIVNNAFLLEIFEYHLFIRLAERS